MEARCLSTNRVTIREICHGDPGTRSAVPYPTVRSASSTVFAHVFLVGRKVARSANTAGEILREVVSRDGPFLMAVLKEKLQRFAGYFRFGLTSLLRNGGEPGIHGLGHFQRDGFHLWSSVYLRHTHMVGV